MPGKITKVLIANRGEISCRAQRACAQLSLPCVAVFTQPDAMSLHVLNASESYCLGTDPKEYLNPDRLLQACKDTGEQLGLEGLPRLCGCLQCSVWAHVMDSFSHARAFICIFAGSDAVFPGYGFLSENAEFSERCAEAGIAFIGPTGETMRAFSQKHTARELAENAGVPILPGTSLLSTGEEALAAARRIGLPVLLKATGGGGGIGIHICRSEEEVVEKFQSAARQGAAAFGDSGVFVEKYVQVSNRVAWRASCVHVDALTLLVCLFHRCRR